MTSSIKSNQHLEDMFVTTKLAAEVKSYKEAVSSIDQSIKTLGLDYIDMVIIHSPQPWTKFREEDRFFEGNREAWRALEEAYKAGIPKKRGTDQRLWKCEYDASIWWKTGLKSVVSSLIGSTRS